MHSTCLHSGYTRAPCPQILMPAAAVAVPPTSEKNMRGQEATDCTLPGAQRRSPLVVLGPWWARVCTPRNTTGYADVQPCSVREQAPAGQASKLLTSALPSSCAASPHPPTLVGRAISVQADRQRARCQRASLARHAPWFHRHSKTPSEPELISSHLHVHPGKGPINQLLLQASGVSLCLQLLVNIAFTVAHGRTGRWCHSVPPGTPPAKAGGLGRHGVAHTSAPGGDPKDALVQSPRTGEGNTAYPQQIIPGQGASITNSQRCLSGRHPYLFALG